MILFNSRRKLIVPKEAILMGMIVLFVHKEWRQMVAAHNVTALLELTNLVQMTINVIRVHFITIHPKITL